MSEKLSTPEKFIPLEDKSTERIEEKEQEIKNKEDKIFQLIRWFHRLGRSIFGRGLILFFVVGGLKLGYDYHRESATQQEIWREFSKKHPQVTRIYYKTLDSVPFKKQNDVLKTRDAIYRLRYKDAVKDYQKNNDSAVPSNLEEALKSFQPSVYERELREMGLGSLIRTNKPLPALKFQDTDQLFKNFFAPSDDLLGKFVSKNEEDLFNPTETNKENIIYIDPSENNKADELHQVLLHEYLHSIQFHHNEKSGFETPLFEQNEAREYYIDEHDFSEGITDLLRLELNSRIQKPSLGMSYPGQTFAIFEIMNSLGNQKFWKLFSEGDLNGIISQFDEIHGEGTAKKLLNSFSGGVALCNPSWASSYDAIETFEILNKKGLLSNERFEQFSNKYGLYFPPAGEKFIKFSDGSIIGFLNIINKKYIQISIRDREGKTNVITDEKPNTGELSINNFPELKSLWKVYLSCATSNERRLAKINLKEALRKYAEAIYQGKLKVNYERKTH